MKLEITFINPNAEKDVDKHLAKILAEGLLNKVRREWKMNLGNDDHVKYSA